MSLQPPCEPEPSPPDALRVFQLADELSRLSQTILEHSAQLSVDSMPAFSQWVLQRGAVVAQLTSLEPGTLAELSSKQRQELNQRLQECLSLDPLIEKQMSDYKAEAAEQIKALKESSALLNKYRTAPRDTSGSQNRNA